MIQPGPLKGVDGRTDLKVSAIKPAVTTPYTLKPEALKQLTENALSQVAACKLGNQENLHPEYWVSVLQGLASGLKNSVDEDLEEFHAVIVGNKLDADLPKSWASSFADIGGFSALVQLLKLFPDKVKTSKEILKCFGLLLTSEEDAGQLASTPSLLDIALLCFRKGDDEVRVLVVQLMTVICCLAPEGHSVVLDALAYDAGIKTPGPLRFQLLMTHLKASPNTELKHSIMALLNAVLNNPTLILDQRVNIRCQLNDLGMQNLLMEVRKFVSLKEDGNELLQHLDRYEMDAVSDIRASQADELDLTDPEAVFAFLLNRTHEDGLSNHLLALLHSLLTIPSHKPRGVDMWKNVQLIVHAATHQASQTSISDLRDLLSTKESIDKSDSESRVHVLEAENARLKDQLSSGKPSVVAPPVRKPPPPPPPPPPAPVPSMAPPPAPPVPILNFASPDSTEVVSKEFLDKYGKLLPASKPVAPLKNFHWSKIPSSKIPETCWGSILTTNQLVSLQASELVRVEQLFSAKAERSGRHERPTGAGVQPKEPKREVVKLIDCKRAYAIDIGLAHFRMSHHALREAIVGMDFCQLDRERLSQLLPLVPSPQEIQAVVAYVNADGGSDPSLLDNAGQFIHSLSDVIGTPDLQTRLSLFLFKQQFAETAAALEQQLGVVEAACAALRSSPSLMAVLKVVLMVGNFLNASSAKGNAFGFRMAALSQLGALKSADAKRSLLHCIVELVEDKCPHLGSRLLAELHCVSVAAKVDSGALEQEVRRVGDHVAKLQRALELVAALDPRSRAARGDNFEAVMGPFYEAALSRHQALEKRLQLALALGDSLCCFFGEDKASLRWEQIFARFDSFLAAYANAQVMLQKQQQAEARKLAQAGRHARPADPAEKKRILDDLVCGVLTSIKQDKDLPQNQNRPHAQANVSSRNVGNPRVGDAKNLNSVLEVQRRTPLGAAGSRPASTSGSAIGGVVVPSRPSALSSASLASRPMMAFNNPVPSSRSQVGGKSAAVSVSESPRVSSLAACRVCKCSAFKPHPFNKDKCAECSHLH